MASRIMGAPGAAAQSPEEVPLNRVQARRLAKMTGLPEQELLGQQIAALRDKLAWRIDPGWLGFELVCGTVVKVDPVTGLKYPVPGATVDILDVDCDWLWFFPPGWPWAWAFPFGLCEVETLATTTTDPCGKFCVWVPRFDIDWVLEWRRERICVPEIFRRPSIADLLANLARQEVRPSFPVGPNPPDPAPFRASADRAGGCRRCHRDRHGRSAHDPQRSAQRRRTCR